MSWPTATSWSSASTSELLQALVRLFAEGVPTSDTEQQTAIRQAIGGGSDGPSRQVGEVHPRSLRQHCDGHERPDDLPARPLPARKRPRLLPAAGLPGRAAHRGGRELRGPRLPASSSTVVRLPDRHRGCRLRALKPNTFNLIMIGMLGDLGWDATCHPVHLTSGFGSSSAARS
jgi:hypothetical protein